MYVPAPSSLGPHCRVALQVAKTMKLIKANEKQFNTISA